VRATGVEQSLAETRFVLQIHGESIPVRTQLIGQHNIENCLAAAAACHQLGIALTNIAQGIEQLQIVPGRLEAINLGQDYRIFVDYAHTDDALRRCVEALKPLTENRLLCVFGAGGDRDRAKRPMLAAATEETDIVIVTSDNPRSEEPQQIIDDILQGFTKAAPMVYVEPDRERAIQLAMELAEPGDTLLVAGKGHETYQIIGNTRHEFDDRTVIRANLKQTPIRLSA
jgi:UDP-N-acetylmuramoyl-L-alanyl-D-glutamate--2,6-diaminopimelate ligase